MRFRSLRLLLSLVIAFAALPAIADLTLRSPEVCDSRALGSSHFRAYAIPGPVSGHAFTTNGGRKIDLDRLPGPRALLVNFWTTWCTPCIEEMPSMDRLQGRVSLDRLMILPLVRDGKGLSEAIRFYRTHDIENLPVAADRFGKISHDHQIGPVPQTLFVDHQGLVKGILIGAVDWESQPVLELLESCLKVKLDQTPSG